MRSSYEGQEYSRLFIDLTKHEVDKLIEAAYLMHADRVIVTMPTSSHVWRVQVLWGAGKREKGS